MRIANGQLLNVLRLFFEHSNILKIYFKRISNRLIHKKECMKILKSLDNISFQDFEYKIIKENEKKNLNLRFFNL